MSNRREELERAVLAAAEQWHAARQAATMPRATELREAIEALIFDCLECNAGGHTCPGCGASVAHYGPRVCPDCDEVVAWDRAVAASHASQDAELERMGREMADERAHLAEQLREIGQGTMQEWMRIVDLEDIAGIPFQARAGWQDHQGSMVLGEQRYGDEYGAFRLTVSVEDLGPLPPIGPENDPAQQIEMAADEPVWTPRMMADVRRGDRIRPTGSTDPAHEMDVTDRYWPPTSDASDRDTWHVTAGKWHREDHEVQPGECCVVLGTDPRPRFFDPAMKVDIRVTPAELAAIEALGGWSERREVKA